MWRPSRIRAESRPSRPTREPLRPPACRVRSAARILLVAACALPAGRAVAGELADQGSLLLRAEEDRELCRSLQTGQVLRYRFQSTSPLVFTAHYHRGDEARTLWRKDELRREEGTLSAAFPARYCLTWFNYQESTLRVEWQVELKP